MFTICIPTNLQKYGYRIALEPDNTAKIASVYNECWNVGSDGKRAAKKRGYIAIWNIAYVRYEL